MDRTFPGKNGLRAVCFATLAVISASSFAQSAEYRRGYDQGYRDGMEAKSAQGQPGKARIVIEEASYGNRGASCDARDHVQQAVGWRRNVAIVANNDLCGDPAPQRPKRLQISYRCGGGPVVIAQAREGSTVALNCR